MLVAAHDLKSCALASSRSRGRLRVVTEQRTVPIADDLWTYDDGHPRLVVAQCLRCGVMTFPRQSSCPRCASDAMESATVDRDGMLWTYTTQEFPPKAPPYAVQCVGEDFTPFAVGYVAFDGVKVEGRLDTTDLTAVSIGMTMETVVVPLYEQVDGTVVETFAFRPVR